MNEDELKKAEFDARWEAAKAKAKNAPGKPAIKSINCPVCQNTCSSLAASCPKCGHPINEPPHDRPNPTVTTEASSAIVVLAKVTVWFGIVAVIIGLFMNSVGWYRMGMPGEGTIFFDRPFFHNFYYVAAIVLVLVVASVVLVAKGRLNHLLYSGLAMLLAIGFGYFSNLQIWTKTRDYYLPYFARDLRNYEGIEAGLSAWKVLIFGALLIIVAGILGMVIASHNAKRSEN